MKTGLNRSKERERRETPNSHTLQSVRIFLISITFCSNPVSHSPLCVHRASAVESMREQNRLNRSTQREQRKRIPSLFSPLPPVKNPYHPAANGRPPQRTRTTQRNHRANY